MRYAKPFIERRLLHLGLIVLLSWAVYSNTFQASFHFDDKVFIDQSEVIAKLENFIPWGPGAKSGILESSGISRRWVGFLTFALNYRVHGLDVTGYHIVNLCIHILNALLVYSLVLLIVKTPLMRDSRLAADNARLGRYVALFSALLFAVHPVQTQAVTYIYQRLASLATLFYVLSLVSYAKARLAHQPAGAGGRGSGVRSQESGVRSDKTKKRTGFFNLKPALWYGASFLSAFLAMKTKEIAFTLPMMIALYELVFVKGFPKKLLLGLLALFVVMLLVFFGGIGAGKPFGEMIRLLDNATRLQTDMPRLDYLYTQFRVMVTYLRLLFVPINQNIDYDYPLYHEFFDPEVFCSFLFLLSLLCAGGYLLYRSRERGSPAQNPQPAASVSDYRIIAFGIFWFFIAHAVESAFIPIIDVIFEHRVYLPSVGFFIAVTMAVFLTADRYGPGRAYLFKGTVLAFTGVLLVYSAAAYARNAVWRDEYVLWNDTIAKSERKARAYTYLGIASAKDNRREEAMDYFMKAKARNPRDVEVLHNLGILYKELGMHEQSVVELEAAISQLPKRHKHRVNLYKALAGVHEKAGNTDAAIAAYEEALKRAPRDRDVTVKLAMLYVRLERFPEAEEAFKLLLRSNPADTVALNSLGNITFIQARYPEALAFYQSAAHYAQEDPEPLYNIALVYDKIGQKKSARTYFNDFIRVSRGAFPEQEVFAGKRLQELR